MKGLIVIDTDDVFFRKLQRNFEKYFLDEEYELTLVVPDTSEYDSLKIFKSIKSKLPSDVYSFFVDINIIDGRDDSYGITIASELRNQFPSVPIFNITDKTNGEVEFDALSLATLENVDGVLVKSFFNEDRFSRGKLEGIMAKAQRKRSYYVGPSPEAPGKPPEYDIAIITALNDPEKRNVERLLTGIDTINKKAIGVHDISLYQEGFIQRKGARDLRVVFCSDDKMGMPSAASLAARMVHFFKPKMVVLLGICAGIKDKCSIGDILVASHVWDYSSGKIEIKDGKRVFSPYMDQLLVTEEVANIVKSYIGKDCLDRIGKEYHVPYDHPPKLKVGFFASGAAVISSSPDVEEIKAQHPKLIGFDMEAYGVFRAVASYTQRKTEVLSIKSVSDFGDEDKNTLLKDQHQAYASYTSASFFCEFIKNEFERIIGV